MGKTKTKSRSVGDSPKPPITIRSTNVKILDDNIAKLEKAIQAGDVSANPSGTAEETLLSTIGIDGKKYELGPSAENTSYDNTDSGLTADDVQGAIDEISGNIDDIEEKIILVDVTGLKISKINGIISYRFSGYTATNNADFPYTPTVDYVRFLVWSNTLTKVVRVIIGGGKIEIYDGATAVTSDVQLYGDIAMIE